MKSNQNVTKKLDPLFLSQLEQTIGKSPQNKKSSQLPTDLPPSDLPPELTDNDLLTEQASKILANLKLRIKEFFNGGENLSEKAKPMQTLLINKLSNLGQEKVNQLSDGGLALTIFIQKVSLSLTELSKQGNPFPAVTSLVDKESSLKFYDILHAFQLLKDNINNPDFNGSFKSRAVECIQLALAYDKLLASSLVTVEHQAAFITPFQRLTQLALFAETALKELEQLRMQVDNTSHEVIDTAITNLSDLYTRSKLIAIVVNEIKAAIDTVTVHSPKYKRYSDDSLRMLEDIQIFIQEIVAIVMEGKFQGYDEFTVQDMKNTIQKKFTSQLHSKYITRSDKIYHELIILLGKSKLTSKYQSDIDQLVKVDLSVIHESAGLNEDDKVNQMQEIIKTAYNKISKLLNGKSIFSDVKDVFADDLYAFIINGFSMPNDIGLVKSLKFS